MILIRSVVFNVVFYVSFVLVALLGVPFLITSDGALKVAKFWARMNVVLTKYFAGIDLEIRGRHNMPEGGCLIAAKHQSALETFAIVPYVGDFAFILKRELNWLPLFGWYTYRSGMIGVNRGARSQALKDMAVEARRQSPGAARS